MVVASETSNVCVHPEKERERMKCSLSNIEGLSAQIENLGNLGPEQLDQTWCDLFGSGRPRQGLRRSADQSARVSATGKSNRRPQTFHSPLARALGQERLGARPIG